MFAKLQSACCCRCARRYAPLHDRRELGESLVPSSAVLRSDPIEMSSVPDVVALPPPDHPPDDAIDHGDPTRAALPPPDHPPDGSRDVIAWVSLDPVRGKLNVYPRGVAAKVERAFSGGLDSVDTGYYGAVIHFHAEGAGCHVQRTDRGKRGVRRVTLHDDGAAAVFVERVPGKRTWILLPPGAPGSVGEVRRILPGADALDIEDGMLEDGSSHLAAASAGAVEPEQLLDTHAESSSADGVLCASAEAEMLAEIPEDVGMAAAAEGVDTLHEALLPGAATAMDAQWVAWVSVDPRRSNLSAYPAGIAFLLEEAHQQGRGTVDLGPEFFGARVHLGEMPVQRTSRGSRDVRRCELASLEQEAVVYVSWGSHKWKAVPPEESEGVEVRRLVVSSDSAIRVSGVLDCTEPAAPSSSSTCSAALPAGSEVPIWEWCCSASATPASASCLPASVWGVYSAELNVEIEGAFMDDEELREIQVGIRSYQISFGPTTGFAWQLDKGLHKRRLVRRRLVPIEERERMLCPAAPETTREQDSCPICCADFAETASMPVLELPGCSHAFHWACVQQLADSGSPCPICRQEVDWSQAAGGGRRSRH